MKLATLKDGTRDGRLVVVSRDLQRAAYADGIAPTLLNALERWGLVERPLRVLYDQVNAARAGAPFEFDVRKAMAPLPRCYQWLDGSAFASHGRLMERAFATGVKNSYDRDPLLYQGASDDFIGPCDEVALPSEADNMDFEGEVAIVTDEVPMGTGALDAASHIKLLMLVNDVSLRTHAVREMKTGFGWIQAKPSTAFSPVAVTPDELGAAWVGGRVELALRVERDGEWFGQPNGREMAFGFPELLRYASYSRRLRPGAIIGSGTFSNEDRAAGSACITERRAIELIETGQAKTPFMRFGERVRIEMLAADGRSIFGAIDQAYVRYEA
ncbi:MAG: Fumarylacetoacetate hydrolase family protein [Gammaproteobacteria bacterium]|jgi:fumarylacetoacetate (FAA) hydrolase|nr:Fumarylacetoacetate hydrolase family protein [Gammaproteobacteria bacterium]